MKKVQIIVNGELVAMKLPNCQNIEMFENFNRIKCAYAENGTPTQKI